MTTPTDESTTGDPEPGPMPVPEPAMAPAVPDRTADNHGMSIRDANLILARAHLRFGLLGLARAELETMAGRDELDDDGIRDLAEARWRTGDTTGAGEAAVAYLDVVPDDVVALVIAAEAQADLGRPGEARRLAGMAMELADGSLDPIFAGMRRSSIWPVEGEAGATGPIGLLFNELHPGPVTPAPGLDRRATDRRPTNGHVAPYAPLDPALPAAFAVGPEAGPGLWDDVPGAALAAEAVEADPTELFHRAQLALDHGQPAAAATGLTLALRASPELAPAVLDLLSGRSEPILLLVRGDAYQIVGRDVEAMRDHAAAASGLATDRTMAAPITSTVPGAAAPAELEPPATDLESGGELPDPDGQPIGATDLALDGTTADPTHQGSDPAASTDPEPPMPDQEDS